jgi:hypothetical protein
MLDHMRAMHLFYRVIQPRPYALREIADQIHFAIEADYIDANESFFLVWATA